MDGGTACAGRTTFSAVFDVSATSPDIATYLIQSECAVVVLHRFLIFGGCSNFIHCDIDCANRARGCGNWFAGIEAGGGEFRVPMPIHCIQNGGICARNG